jgi:hypothetical protein
MNEHGSQGQSAVGSELLLGMHGFVGGQSQNSGRAPGLQHAASVSRGWRRIVLSRSRRRRRTKYEAPWCAPIKRRRGWIGGGPGAGNDSAGGYYSRDVSPRLQKDAEEAVKQSIHTLTHPHTPRAAGCRGWPYHNGAVPCQFMSFHVISCHCYGECE